MYTYVNGLKYDTEVSDYIGGSKTISLYKTKNNRYFYASICMGMNIIHPMEKEEAFNWAVDNLPRKVVETHFNIQEA